MKEEDVKRSLLQRAALGTAVGVMALGAVACEMEGGENLEPGVEEPGLEEGGENLGGEGGDL